LRTGWSKLAEKQRERIFESIGRSAEIVSRLADDLLSVAALQSGEVPYAMSAVDLCSVIGQAVDEARAAHSDLTFAVDTPSAMQPVWADPRRLWQVISNLLANAAVFTPKEGSIDVLVDRTEDMMEVRVRDQGPGVKEEDRTGLFQPFFQGRAQDRPSRGTGLGLYICRVIVEAHGGSIWVQSPTGAGATFGFSVPLAPGASPSASR
jgi:signal transduction histidine kinase